MNQTLRKRFIPVTRDETLNSQTNQNSALFSAPCTPATSKFFYGISRAYNVADWEASHPT